MTRIQRSLSLTLCAALLAASWPAAAIERLAEVRVIEPTAPLAAPKGPTDLAAATRTPDETSLTLALPPVLAVEADQAAVAPEMSGAESLITTEAGTVSPGPAPASAPAPDPIAGWVESARRFDNAAKAPRTAVVMSVAAPALVLGAAAAPHALQAFHALAPVVNSASYDAANVLSVAFPLPEVYSAFRRGNAKGFPMARAALGAVGTLALGLVNAVVLGKPLWGIMHVFIALGMIAPYVIGKTIEKRGAPASYAAPTRLAEASWPAVWRDRLLHDRALQATAGVGLLMLALSGALYAGAAAFVPALLAAHMGAAAIAHLLLGIQLAKGAMFVAAFAPDVAALLRGKPAHGFSKAFTTIYLASVAAFTVWGFSAAAASPAGSIRGQYLVHGLRNLVETVAAGLSLAALRRRPSA